MKTRTSLRYECRHLLLATAGALIFLAVAGAMLAGLQDPAWAGFRLVVDLMTMPAIWLVAYLLMRKEWAQKNSWTMIAALLMAWIPIMFARSTVDVLLGGWFRNAHNLPPYDYIQPALAFAVPQLAVLLVVIPVIWSQQVWKSERRDYLSALADWQQIADSDAASMRRVYDELHGGVQASLLTLETTWRSIAQRIKDPTLQAEARSISGSLGEIYTRQIRPGLAALSADNSATPPANIVLDVMVLLNAIDEMQIRVQPTPSIELAGQAKRALQLATIECLSNHRKYATGLLAIDIEACSVAGSAFVKCRFHSRVAVESQYSSRAGVARKESQDIAGTGLPALAARVTAIGGRMVVQRSREGFSVLIDLPHADGLRRFE